MNYLIDEELDDDCFEDPITLIDSEQARINAIWREAENAKLHENTSVNLVTKNEPTQKRKFVLPVTFFDIPSNLKLLNCCCPLTIKVVDCDKFPWYYKKYKRNSIMSTDETIVIEDDLTEEEMDIMKPIAYENIPKRAKIKCGPLSKKILQMRLEPTKQKEDVEETNAIGQKDATQLDYKRNVGLIGLKIRPLKDFDKIFNKTINKTTKQSKSLDKNNTNKYLLDVNTVLQNVGTIITPITHNENNNVIVSNVSKNYNVVNLENKIKNNNQVIKKKRKRRRANNDKKKSDKMGMKVSTTNTTGPSIESSVEKPEKSSVSAPKSSNVKDKRKTNKYFNDLLKKKITAMSIIKSLKKLNEKNKSDYKPKSSTMELEYDTNVHNENSITPLPSNYIIEHGSISPVLPCKTTVCNKSTPKSNETDPKLDLLKKKLIDDINNLNAISSNVIAENVDQVNSKISDVTLELSDDHNGKIKEADKTSSQNSVNSSNNTTTGCEIVNLINSCTKQSVGPSALTDLENKGSASTHNVVKENVNSMVQQTDTNVFNDFQIRNLDGGVSSISGVTSGIKSSKTAHNAGNNIHNVIIKSTRPRETSSNQNPGVNDVLLNRLNSETKKLSNYVPPNQRTKYINQSGLPIKTVVNNRPIEMSVEIEQSEKALGFKRAIPHYHSVPSTLNPNNHLTPCMNNCMTTPLNTTTVSYRMPPLANVYSKDAYKPYWNTYFPPPPPPPPLPPPPPPPPPPPREMPQPHYAAQYLPKHIPIYPPTNKPNMKVYNRLNLINCPTTSNAINTNGFNIQTDTNVKLVSSKEEMLEELEKEILVLYNKSLEEKKQEDNSAMINNTYFNRTESNNQSKSIVPMSSAINENLYKNSNDQPLFLKKPTDVKDAIKNKIKDDSASSSNYGMTTGKIKPVMKIDDVSKNSKNTNNMLPTNTGEKNNNENKEGSIVVGAKNNALHQNTAMTMPRNGPSWKVKKPNIISSPQTDLSRTKDVKSSEYSPPILPIPTYGSTLELLSRVSGGTNILCLNYKKRGYEEESRHKQDLQQRKMDHKRDKIQRLNDEKAAKKISLDEYKKRSHKSEYSSDWHAVDYSLSAQSKRNRKEQVTSKSVNSLSGIVNHDQDLGYDSDSTVKL